MGFVRRIVVALAVGVFPPLAVADAADWIMKISEAATGASFSGTLIYASDGEIRVMDVARRVENGLIRERIYSLDGEPREIVRNENRIWCYMPDQNMVVQDYWRAEESGFPGILPGDLNRLRRNYDIEEGGEGRIAGRTTIMIKVSPGDIWRYGYTLWADKQSGLLLRSDLVARDGEVVGQYLFADIEINGLIEDARLTPVTNMDKLELFNNLDPISESSEASRWLFTEIPDGYQLSSYFRRMSPMGKEETEHFVYSDGLSSLSVFIKESSQGQNVMMGASRMGAVHAYRARSGNHLVTVMGEVPAETVKVIAQGVRFGAG